MLNPEVPESWVDQTDQLLSNTKNPGCRQFSLCPASQEYTNTQTQPYCEYYNGLPGYLKTIDARHEHYHPIEDLCQPAEVRDASECLLYEGAVNTENCNETTLQSISTLAVFRASQSFGFANSPQLFGYSKDGPHRPKGQIDGTLDLGGAAGFHGQHNGWEVTGDPTTASTWMASPPSRPSLSNSSSSPSNMCVVSPHEDPLTRHQFTSHPHGSPPYVIVPAESPPEINVRSKFVDTRDSDATTRQKKPRDSASRLPPVEQVALSPFALPGHSLASNRSERRSKKGNARKIEITQDEDKIEYQPSEKHERAKQGNQKKRAMTEEERRVIADTRQIGACIRCRMQRLKCDANPQDRKGPCLTCARVDMTSAKVVHRQPCIRTKLSDVVLYRDPRTVNAERGWPSTDVMDSRDWDGEDIFEIFLMMRGLCSVPMAIEVRRFVNKPEDQVNYIWLDEGSAEVKETVLKPYALASVIDSRRAFDEYVEANAVKSWEENTKRGDTNELILDHYKEALRHYRRVNVEENLIDQRILLNLFKLRFALHVSINRSWVYDRNAKSVGCLGMMPAKGDFHPLLDRVPTPPTISEQLDSISHSTLIKFHEKVLEDLEKLCCKKIRTSFFTVYVVIFTMLHELALVTEHYRLKALLCHGKEQRMRQQSYQSYLEVVEKSANILLLHWQYYRRAPDSLCPADSWIGDHITKWFWTGLSHGHEKFCRESWKKMREIREDVRCPEKEGFGSPLYWISQMFEDDWSLEYIWDRDACIEAKRQAPDARHEPNPSRAKRRK